MRKEKSPAKDLPVLAKLATMTQSSEVSNSEHLGVIAEAVAEILVDNDFATRMLLFGLLQYLSLTDGREGISIAANYAFTYTEMCGASQEAVWRQWSGERTVKS